MPSEIGQKLDEARKELLDLSLRNPLINFNRLKAKGVEIENEMPREIFRILVINGKSMSFLPTEEIEDDEEQFLAQPEEVVVDGALPEHLTDTKLQTPHGPGQLQKRLLNTFYAARTYIEEQGVNILYMALGMLKWYDASESQIQRYAPLILIPVEITRTSVRARFHVVYSGEEIGANLSLQAKLKTDFGIVLPGLPEEADEIDVESYFDQVENAIREMPRWCVEREAVEIGFFSFGKFLMYRDLDINGWPEEVDPTDHQVIKALLGNGFEKPQNRLHDDAYLDGHLPPDNVHHVVDADSTQILAMLDVREGLHLVVQGPPGTGKSQTICNLVAEAIGHGKKVLFVSEKMAALEVVKRRLDQVHLGDACLELHSHKTRKKDLLAELKRTLSLNRPVLSRFENELGVYIDSRDRLNSYCAAVNTPVGQSGLTPYQVFGRLIELRNRLDGIEIPPLHISSLSAWSGEEYARREEYTGQMQSLVSRIGLPGEHVFWGSQRKLYLPTERSQIVKSGESARTATEQLGRSASSLAEALQLPKPQSAEDARIPLQSCSSCTGSPESPRS